MVTEHSLTDRQIQILAEIVRQHALNADPIPSKDLADRLELSSATIRNEMAELEEKGMLYSPHTSAGRIPTVKGYQYYVAHQLEQKPLPEREAKILGEVEHQVGRLPVEEQIKYLAKAMAALSRLAVVASLGQGHAYCTGLSSLVVQPEFTAFDQMRSFASVFDSLDQIMEELCQQHGSQDIEIRIGNNNPFGRQYGLVLTEYGHGDVMGLLGPVRMHYDINVSRLEAMRNILNRLIV